MKRMFWAITFVGFLIFVGNVIAADTRSPIIEFNLGLASGTTTAKNKTAVYSGLSIFTINGNGTVLDLTDYKPNDKKITLQVKKIEYALANTNGATYTSGNASGATYTLYYIPFNVNDPNIKAGSGVTAITNAMDLSGSSNVPQAITLTPVTKFVEFGLLSGMTQFKTFNVSGIVY